METSAKAVYWQFSEEKIRMANKHEKMFNLMSRTMQTKATMRCHFISSGKP